MFLIDDILLAPVRGVAFIAQAVHDAAEDHIESEQRALRDELNDLYMQLDMGMIEEETFDAREEEILDRLDELHAIDASLES
ncbi:gas vesicle protein GvpG [Salisaeta longa]|uniref:gas vesicle protein GvpG n=1 Tax=Salisaeta longa TaxID=503170 RepID=UPI0003B35DA3|nr:gas vesicle protein GvpG [Salisaeta longa]